MTGGLGVRLCMTMLKEVWNVTLTDLAFPKIEPGAAHFPERTAMFNVGQHGLDVTKL